MKSLLLMLVAVICVCSVQAQIENINDNPFRQLGTDLPTPNTYRTASGTPGKDYWQQKVDYDINIKLDEAKLKIIGDQVIAYHNQSPDELKYLWLQLDQNVRKKNSKGYGAMWRTDVNHNPKYIGGYDITNVSSPDQNITHTINGTMMRVDLPKGLKPGERITLNISWSYNINDSDDEFGRAGYEVFIDKNYVFCISQFYPRMCKYYDAEGWQNKQFLGRGEFTLEFGDFNVNLTVPSDHLVAATGELQNPEEVLSKEYRKRLDKAQKEYETPVIISSLKESLKRSKNKSSKYVTWKYKANDVRDFAFATSRRFIWDAMNVKLPNGKEAMAQSMWVPEGDCLWKKYSTKTVAHALKFYSDYTIDYPYPVAWSIDGNMGMEYPMITFNYGRCEDDGTYSKRMKYGHIGVIIHEIGHFFFPMIVNSDERQWTWMDEGINTFVQYLAEQNFERLYPSRRGQAYKVVDFMKTDKSRLSPIMSNSETVKNFGSNAYFKPAVGLNILRETIVGRDLFDKAFKGYAQTWAFKTPTPADFFRYMEDATAVDLDWFWRAWFYTTDHVDIAITDVNLYSNDNKIPMENEVLVDELETIDKVDKFLSNKLNAIAIKQTYNEKDPSLTDSYTTKQVVKPLKEDEITKDFEYPAGKYLYEITFEKPGGVPMPIILKVIYQNNKSEVIKVPAEVWQRNHKRITKDFAVPYLIKSLELDPYIETADVDRSNNYFPRRILSSRFESFKKQKEEKK